MTDLEYEAIYLQGRKAWREEFGEHGPTLHMITRPCALNPYIGVRAIIWQRGYYQDVRRLPTTAYVNA